VRGGQAQDARRSCRQAIVGIKSSEWIEISTQPFASIWHQWTWDQEFSMSTSVASPDDGDDGRRQTRRAERQFFLILMVVIVLELWGVTWLLFT
jgi:hypothetical protein